MNTSETELIVCESQKVTCLKPTPMNYTPEYYQARQSQQDYRSSTQANVAPIKKVTPADGEERAFLYLSVFYRFHSKKHLQISP